MASLENVSLSAFTTLQIGGPARFMFRVTSRAGLDHALAFARKRRLPHFILGSGSNLLVSDRGFPGVVIKMELPGVSFKRRGEALLVTANAGENWDGFVAQTVSRGAWGLENLSWIPGTVGAAPVQNIGAYGAEVKDCIESVRVLHAVTGAERVLTNLECRFAYRDSLFKGPEGKNEIILSVTFRLALSPRPNLEYKDLQQHFGAQTAPSQAEIRAAVIAIRTAKFPDMAQVGTAGSFWKNPVLAPEEFARLKEKFPGVPAFPSADGSVKVSLAWILDRVCGLRGHHRDHVRLFENQPLVLVTEKGASAADVLAFESEIRARVTAKTGLTIEREVNVVGKV